ncbi:hypothetical protein [Methyloceanibacter sp.]|uniref:hypothetical protein n=1 Tax=Methyloceanibacter sp. TaxID=1965321 RepID=UPI002CECC94E|nr:hypothetical protein [Methyloceanibacter sp.]HML93242.1 hypothetical protein [Methyloceanibacter sp.]
MIDWLSATSTIGMLLGTAVIAAATLLLWRVTHVLAIETRRLVDAGTQPHVVAILEPNRWSMLHADLTVENTGSGTAYEIQISFDPPLSKKVNETDGVAPLQRISVLKPGQRVSSFLSEFEPLMGNVYSVTISWRRQGGVTPESNQYTLDMSALEAISRLGGDPMVQIAQETKHIREDLRRVTTGHQRLGVNVYSASDRDNERRAFDEAHANKRKRQLKSPDKDA